MSTLLQRVLPAVAAGRADGADPAGTPVGSPSLLGALAALRAGAAGILVAAVVVLLSWATAADGGAGPSAAARAAGQAWLLTHHAAFAVPRGTVALAPLGLVALPAYLLWAAAGRAVVAAGVDDMRGVARLSAALATTYAVLAAAVAVASETAGVRPLPGVAFGVAWTLAAVAGGFGAGRAAVWSDLLSIGSPGARAASCAPVAWPPSSSSPPARS
jgi:hypothetical protein